MAKIYERNPDTGKVRSRKIVDPMKGDEDVDERMHDIDTMLEQWIGNSIIRKQLRDLIIKEITK